MPAGKEIAFLAQKAIHDRVFPGCVIGIYGGGEKAVFPFGTLAYGQEKADADTVYDLASVTKSIPLASLAAICISEGKLSLGALVREYLPDLKNDHDATIEDLVRYRVRGLQLSKLKLSTFEEIRTRVLESGFEGPPGEHAYTNLPAYVLGLIIERVTGKPLHELAHERLFGPLGMEKTTFFPTASDCAPTEADARGEVRGLPHDESAYVHAKAHRSAGHAGLFSTAGDLLIFLEGMLTGKLPEITDAAEQGLGWEVQAAWMGEHVSQKSFGKTGFTGTCVCVDRVKQKGFVALSNRTYPTRPGDTTAINAFRRGIANIVFEV